MKKPELLTSSEKRLLLEAYQDLSPASDSIQSHLKGVLADALHNPGSLTRAQLSFKILSLYGESEKQALELACAIEYFHTASLILDDLPCMDDANIRRGVACVHTTYGEGAAILGALALITRAYALVWGVINSRPWHERQKASEYLEAQIGTTGILNGQALDIHFKAENANGEDVAAVAVGKTVSLIRLSLVFPAMLGGADQATLQNLDQLAYHWGLAYQATDDVKDLTTGSIETGKTPQRDQLLNRPNMALATGPLSNSQWIEFHLHSARQLIQKLVQPKTRWSGSDMKINWRFLFALQAHMESAASEQLSRAQHVA